MAKFKCKNCEHTFDKFCDGLMDVNNVKCPKCESHWVELRNSEKVKFKPFPSGPYDDPIYPIPTIDPSPWPQDPVNPWPPNRYWIHTPMRYSINKHTGSVSV